MKWLIMANGVERPILAVINFSESVFDAGDKYDIEWWGNNNPTHYNLRINDTISEDIFSTSGSFTLTSSQGFVSGTNFIYVRACNSAGCSPWSNFHNIYIFGDVSETEAETTTNYSLSPALTLIEEDTSSQSFTITRSGDLPAETIYVSTTVTHGAENVNDYIDIDNQAVSFEAGEENAVVKVDINNDTIQEQDETFGLIVQRNPSDPPSTHLAESTFTIKDDDNATATDSELEITTDNIIVAASNLSARAYSDAHH